MHSLKTDYFQLLFLYKVTCGFHIQEQLRKLFELKTFQAGDIFDIIEKYLQSTIVNLACPSLMANQLNLLQQSL